MTLLIILYKYAYTKYNILKIDYFFTYHLNNFIFYFINQILYMDSITPHPESKIKLSNIIIRQNYKSKIVQFSCHLKSCKIQHDIFHDYRLNTQAVRRVAT